MHIDVRYRGGLTPAIRDWAQRRVLFALGQFGGRIRGVRVHLSDDNGPKGGADQRCLMTASMSPSGEVVAEVVDPDLYAAVSRAADRLCRRVRTELDRERTGRRAAPARGAAKTRRPRG